MAALGAEPGFWYEWGAAVAAEFRGGRCDRLLGNVCEGLPRRLPLCIKCRISRRLLSDLFLLGILLVAASLVLLCFGCGASDACLSCGALFATDANDRDATDDHQDSRNPTANNDWHVVLGKEDQFFDWAIVDIRLVDVDVHLRGVFGIGIVHDDFLVIIDESEVAIVIRFNYAVDPLTCLGVDEADCP